MPGQLSCECAGLGRRPYARDTDPRKGRDNRGDAYRPGRPRTGVTTLDCLLSRSPVLCELRLHHTHQIFPRLGQNPRMRASKPPRTVRDLADLPIPLLTSLGYRPAFRSTRRAALRLQVCESTVLTDVAGPGLCKATISCRKKKTEVVLPPNRRICSEVLARGWTTRG